MKEVHISRFERLVEFIDKKEEKTFELKRMEIAKIVGVSEGDSLKKIFLILEENKDIYSEKFIYKKENRKHFFEKITQIKKEQEVELKPKINKKDIDLLNTKLKHEINDCFFILNKIKRMSVDDYFFCKYEFKDDFAFMNLYLKAIENNINFFDGKENIVEIIKEKIENIYTIKNYLRLYSCIS